MVSFTFLVVGSLPSRVFTMFDAVTLIVNVPASEGIPERLPVMVLKIKPLGTPSALSVTGAVPLKTIACEYSSPTVPAFSDDVDIAAFTGFAAMVKDTAAVESPAVLVAVIVVEKVPAFVGLPEIVPVELSSFNPAGRFVAAFH